MQVLPQIAFRGIVPSPELEAEVHDRVAELKTLFGQLTSCHVVLVAPHRRHRTGNIYRVRIHLAVPRNELVVDREPPEHHASEDLLAALRNTIDAMRRQLEDYARAVRGDVKHHEEPARGRDMKIFPEADYGFLQTCSFPRPEDANLSAILAPAFGLSAQEEFWRGCRAESLAILLAPQQSKVYLLPFACPLSIDVSRDFRLALLVRLAAWLDEYFLLALSLNAARLYHGSPIGLAPLELPAGTPENFAAFVAGTEVGRAVRFQSALGAGARPFIQGGPSHADDFEVRREEYCRAVAHSVASCTAQSHDVPVVLAAAKELHPIFRAAYASGNLLKEALFGCPDHQSEVDLRNRVERLVESLPNGPLAIAKEQLRSSKGKSAETIEAIVAAAVEGRVHSLLLVLDGRIWGHWDAETGTVHVETVGAEGPPKSDDLTELALRETLRHGGQVFAIPPEENDSVPRVAAVLRW